MDRLLELRDAGVQLGTQSIEFLMFEDPAARDDFANGLRDKPLVQQTCVGFTALMLSAVCSISSTRLLSPRVT